MKSRQKGQVFIKGINVTQEQKTDGEQKPPENNPPREKVSVDPDTPRLITRLKKELAEKELEVEKLENSSRGFKENLGRLNSSLEKTVSSYRAMVLKAHPDIPEELIDGKNVDEVNASLEKAGKIINRVKKNFKEESRAGEFPVGAPARSPDGMAGLNPREKIQYAVGGSS